MPDITSALISVSDKSNLGILLEFLNNENIKIISTGGTYKFIRDRGYKAIEVSEYTGHPEMMGGRIKTLHPKIHAGILAKRDSHLTEMEKSNYPMIDLVVVNLYPFQETIASDADFDESIENIDIGGPTMIRAAAKNFKDVTVLSNPSQYSEFIDLYKAQELDLNFRKKCAQKVFEMMSAYDHSISSYLVNENNTKSLINEDILKNPRKLRYGENPHQNAFLYILPNLQTKQIANSKILQGKELSFNNMVDADSAWECIKEFEETSCVIVKHANPCGVASAKHSIDAYNKAFETDPTSAFGGVIAINTTIDKQLAETIIKKQFLEIIIATDYSKDALNAFKEKPNVRVLIADLSSNQTFPGILKTISGGLLWQDSDNKKITEKDLKVVSKRKPDQEEINDLLFAWKVAKFVKSNAIVFAKNNQTIGIGAGQMSRVISTEIAALKAKQEGLESSQSAMASDAFFPFRDGIDQAAKVGITSIIQPGGSMRDGEVIDAADEHDIAMVFTGIRHFRH